MEFLKVQAIGEGSFAKVSLAKPVSQSSSLPELMAVKYCLESESDTLTNERMILDQLKDCPEIIRCYGDCFTVENGNRLYNIALEYASGGCLEDRVMNTDKLRLSESDVRRYTKSILKGIGFIHKNGFVHCDIKLENILLFEGDEVKIADFGFSKKAESKLKYKLQGSPLYMAPEMVSNAEQGQASDIWAFGCLVLEMFTGKPAWKYTDVRKLFMKIAVGAEIPEIPGELSDEGKDFLGKCFVKDASKRWTAEMLLNHPFIINNAVADDDDDEPTTSTNEIPKCESEKESESESDWESKTEIEAEAETKIELCIGKEPCTSNVTRILQQLVIEETPDWSFSSGLVTVR